MQRTITHPVNLERCHIFESFFYKRLLHAMGGGKLTCKNYDKVREGYQAVKRCSRPPSSAPPSPLLSDRTTTPSARVPFPARIVTWPLLRARLLHACFPFPGCRSWTRDVDLFEKDFIFVPINENLHWSLAVIWCAVDATQPLAVSRHLVRHRACH